MKKWKQKQPGNIADILVTGIFILAMTVMMLSSMEHIQLLHQKTEVGQIARRYILRMECVGGLTGDDRTALVRELTNEGVTNINLSGSTLGEVGYGERIVLNISGKLGGRYDFSEKRVSTAKY